MLSGILSVLMSSSQLERPNLEIPSVYDIGTALLRQHGISALILDIDQTIVDQGQNDIPTKMITHLKSLANLLDGKLCFLTNEPSPERKRRIEQQTGIKVVETSARKPDQRAFADALLQMGEQPSKSIAVVGDRRWTDILGGNKSGLFTIRVLPKSPSKDPFWVRAIRPIEDISAKTNKWEALAIVGTLASITGINIVSILGYLTDVNFIWKTSNLHSIVPPTLALAAFLIFYAVYLRLSHIRNSTGLKNSGNTVTYFFNTYPLALRVAVAFGLLIWLTTTTSPLATTVGAVYIFSGVTMIASVSSFFRFYHTSLGRWVRVFLDVGMFIYLSNYLGGFHSLIPLAFLTVPVATAARYLGPVIAAVTGLIALGAVSRVLFVSFESTDCVNCGDRDLSIALFVVFVLAFLFTSLVFSLEYGELLRPFSQMAFRFAPDPSAPRNDLEGYLENSAVVLGCSELLIVNKDGVGWWLGRTDGPRFARITGEDATELSSFLLENRESLLSQEKCTQSEIDQHSNKLRKIETALSRPIKNGVKSVLVVPVPQSPDLLIIALNCLTRNGALRSQFSVQHLTVLRMISLGLGASVCPFVSKEAFE